MLMLDTNVLSAMMSAELAGRVADWLLDQPSEALFTAAVCQAEILSGIASLPNGRPRAGLEEAARAMFADDFRGRVLPFDDEAASAYAEVFAARRCAGSPSGTIDLMLAAIARAWGQRRHPQRRRLRGGRTDDRQSLARVARPDAAVLPRRLGPLETRRPGAGIGGNAGPGPFGQGDDKRVGRQAPPHGRCRAPAGPCPRRA